jgi:integrase
MIRVKQLEALKFGEWISDDSTRGGGRFTARRLAGGAVCFYFRYTLPDGSRDLLKIGEWSERGDGQFLLTLEQARIKATRLRERYMAGERDLRGAIQEAKERTEREALAAKDREAVEAEAKRRRAELSLGGLLGAYVGLLRAGGKTSAGSVEQALHRHIRDAFPKLWDMPVDDADEDAVSPALDRLTEAGKLREAAKLRSYLRAAFSAAVKSRKAGGAIPLRRFNVRANPLRDMPTIDGASGVRERALSVDELRAYWRRISAMPDPDGALLRFHLLTGGQRVAQLSRLTVRDLDGDAIILSDPKGRRDKPRRHLVPLLPDAVACLEAMAKPRVGPYLFTVTSGETGAGYDALGGLVQKVAAAMIQAGESAQLFTPGDIRRTVETRLAALGVPKETRAHLQSHGLSGVQDRHYNVHDYAGEKLGALERLYRLAIGSQKASITSIKSRKRT